MVKIFAKYVQKRPLQRIGKNYPRIRDYLGADYVTRKPKLSNCQQSVDYVDAQLRILNEKDLIQSKESYIATGFIDPELDQNIIDPKKSKSRSELENSLCRGSLAWLGRQTHNLAKDTNQIRNLETNGANRPMPEVAGSNPAPRIEFMSVRANGTNETRYPKKNPREGSVCHVQDSKMVNNHARAYPDKQALFLRVISFLS